jgi:hypothetical protein
MSRVENEPSTSAQEAERAAKEADKRSRDAKRDENDRQAFGKLLQGRKEAQESARAGRGTQEKAQSLARTGAQQAKAEQSTAGQQAERLARLARGGALQSARVKEQVEGFQGALDQSRERSQAQDQGLVAARNHGTEKDRMEHEDRNEALVHKGQARTEREADLAALERQEKAKPFAAIDANDRGERDGKRREHGSASTGASSATQASPAVQATTTAQPVRQIPPELLEKLVSTVYLAVTEKGLKEFQIELKDGPLKGGFLKISADGGKVVLQFAGLDAQAKNLVESSKGELMRRLVKKGLSLARLDVR